MSVERLRSVLETLPVITANQWALELGQIPGAIESVWEAYGGDYDYLAATEPAALAPGGWFERQLIDNATAWARATYLPGEPPPPRKRDPWGAIVGTVVGALGLSSVVGTTTTATAAISGASEPRAVGEPQLARGPTMPNGNGLVATNGSFPWTTLIQQIGAVAGQVLPAIVNGHRRMNGSIAGATPLEPGAVMPTAWTGAVLPALGAAGAIAVRGAARIAPILARVAMWAVESARVPLSPW